MCGIFPGRGNKRAGKEGGTNPNKPELPPARPKITPPYCTAVATAYHISSNSCFSPSISGAVKLVGRVGLQARLPHKQVNVHCPERNGAERDEGSVTTTSILESVFIKREGKERDRESTDQSLECPRPTADDIVHVQRGARTCQLGDQHSTVTAQSQHTVTAHTTQSQHTAHSHSKHHTVTPHTTQSHHTPHSQSTHHIVKAQPPHRTGSTHVPARRPALLHEARPGDVDHCGGQPERRGGSKPKLKG